MNILFFDATNEWLIVETFNTEKSGSPVYSMKGYFPRESSFRLVKEIQIALEKSEIDKPDLIVACNGPGSFTGIRICVTTARNFAQIWKLPVVEINSLEFYSGYYFKKKGITSIVMIEGGQNKYYTGMFDQTGFKGCYDITIEEFARFFPDGKTNCEIYSVNGKIADSVDMNSDIPEAFFSVKEISKKIITNEIYNYKKFKPNYMRGTYAKEKKK